MFYNILKYKENNKKTTKTLLLPWFFLFLIFTENPFKNKKSFNYSFNQLFLLKLSTMYFYLKKPNSEVETLIILKYFISKKERFFTFSTECKISPIDWDKESKTPKAKRGRSDLSFIKRKLQKYSDFLDKTILDFDLKKISVTKENLKTSFNLEFKNIGGNNTFIYFSDFADDFIEKAPRLYNKKTKNKYSKNSIKSYKKNINIFKEFEKSINKKVRIDSFNLELYNLLHEFLTNKAYKSNTIGDTIKVLKSLVKKSVDFGCLIDEKGLENFVVQSESIKAITLNENEINKIFKFDFSDNDRLENARDHLIIGLWTGLRVNDFLNISELDINSDFITVKPQKTKNTSGISVVIPLHHHVKYILKRRGMPRKISDVKFNLYIKEVCKIVGINEFVHGSLNKKVSVNGLNKEVNRKVDGLYPKYKLVGSHVCRRSFATNLYKAKFPIIAIMSITGHKTESSFLKYIQVTRQEHAEYLKSFWKEYYANQGIDIDNFTNIF